MKARTELAAATGEFAQTLYDLAASDLGEQLSHSISGLAGVEIKLQELLRVQTEQDMITFMSTGKHSIGRQPPRWSLTSFSADEYARLVNSVRVSSSHLWYIPPP